MIQLIQWEARYDYYDYYDYTMKTFKNICAAFQFMTVLPVPVKTGMEHLERSMAWYPLTGAAIGLLTAYGYRLSAHVLPGAAASVMTVVFYLVLTRGLHMDGFMDTLDGFFSHRDRESILRIMKDPVVGSFAVLGAAAWFFLLVVLLPRLTVTGMVMIHIFNRTAPLIMPLFYSYPRESGTGKFFVRNVTARTVCFAFILVAVSAVGVYFSTMPRHGWVNNAVMFAVVYGGAFCLALLAAAAVGAWSQKKIGGITGDVIGFTIETIHLLLALALTAFAFLVDKQGAMGA